MRSCRCSGCINSRNIVIKGFIDGAVFHLSRRRRRVLSAGSQRQALDDGCMQGGGALWHRGGVDSWPDKVSVLIMS
jgi:hypothetical protein